MDDARRPDRRPIVLVGMMATGKTTAGRLVAERLGRPFVDLDADVERRSGRSIAAIFSADGEAAFRRLESEALADALVRTDGPVVATGGGAVLDPANRAAMAAAATTVWLRAEPAELAARVAVDPTPRPLLAGAGADDVTGRLTTLAAERAEAYAESADHVVEVDRLSPAEVVDAVLVAVRDTAGTVVRPVSATAAGEPR